MEFHVPLSHAQLVDIGAAWLRSCGCTIVLTEFYCTTEERPDVFAWRDSYGVSYLVECKTSRADFRRDAAKPWRQDPARGMGAFRWMLCPEGLILADELPPRWGLVYVTVEPGRKPSPKLVHGANPRCTYTGRRDFAFPERHVDGEARILLSALARLRNAVGRREFNRAIQAPYKRPTPPAAAQAPRPALLDLPAPAHQDPQDPTQ